MQREEARSQTQLNEGDSRFVSVESNSKVTMTIMGQEMELTMDGSFTYQFDIGAVDSSGTADVTGTYYQITLEAPAMFRGSTGVNPLIAANDPARGKSFTFRLGADGAVSDMQGNEAIVTAMLKELDSTLLKGTSFEDQIRGQMDDDAVREDLEGVFNVYPMQPVVVDDSWSNRQVTNAFVPTIINTTFSLKEWDAGRVTVSHRATLSTPAGRRTAMGGMSVIYDLSGTSTGETRFDEATGWIRSSKTTSRASGTGTIEGGMFPQPTEIPMTVRSTLTIETVRNQ